jgi:hypothetical protein
VLGTYGSAVLIVLASTLVGQAICTATGQRGWSWTAPAVGLATLIAICVAAVRLPGGAVTSVVLVATVLVVASIWLGMQGWPRWSWLPVLIAIAALALTAIPFLVQERVGLLGVPLLNDSAFHLLWAEGLRSDPIAELYPVTGNYPIGPHALMATVATATAIPMDLVLNGLVIAVPVMTALAAMAFLRALSPPLAALGALLAAFAYLAVAYFGQAAFKEPIQALFLLAFVGLFRELVQAPRSEWVRRAVSLVLLAAGSVLTFTLVGGLVWYVAFLGVWTAFALIATRPRPVVVWRVFRGALPALLTAGAALILAIGSQLDEALAFVRGSGTSSGIPQGAPGGNIPDPLSPFEALGIWPSTEFVVPPADDTLQVGLDALALAAVLFGAVWWLRRRELTLPAAVASGWLLYLFLIPRESHYVLAKELAIMSPLIMLLSAGALLGAVDRASLRSKRAVLRRGLVTLFAAAFFAGAGYSSLLGLLGGSVASTAQADDLAILRPMVQGAPTLFLGNDNHVGWQLRGVPLGYFSTTARGPLTPPLPVALRPETPYRWGQPLDFDSVRPGNLDGFRFVIAPRSGYQSAPPPNFHLVKTTTLYELWQRTGPTPPQRRTLEVNGAPGAILDCSQPAARGLSRLRGWASVLPAPVVIDSFPTLDPLRPYQAAEVELPLSQGTWRLALQYTSPVPLRIEAGGANSTVPANTGHPGPFFAAGIVRQPGTGPLRVRIAEDLSPFSTRYDRAFIGALAATRAGRARRVPLASACGRYVDWYRLQRPRARFTDEAVGSAPPRRAG